MAVMQKPQEQKPVWRNIVSGSVFNEYSRLFSFKINDEITGYHHVN
jgi:hypothetical protein